MTPVIVALSVLVLILVATLIGKRRRRDFASNVTQETRDSQEEDDRRNFFERLRHAIASDPRFDDMELAVWRRDVVTFRLTAMAFSEPVELNVGVAFPTLTCRIENGTDDAYYAIATLKDPTDMEELLKFATRFSGITYARLGLQTSEPATEPPYLGPNQTQVIYTDTSVPHSP